MSTKEYGRRCPMCGEHYYHHALREGLAVCPQKGTGSGGPTVDDINRPYCKPDQSCCDFTCGN